MIAAIVAETVPTKNTDAFNDAERAVLMAADAIRQKVSASQMGHAPIMESMEPESDPAPLPTIPRPESKWSVKDYYEQGISSLRGEIYTDKNGVKQRSKGIHSVYSGFNQGLKELFPGVDVVETTNQMVADKVITIWPTKGGVKLYLYEERTSTERPKKAKFAMGADGFPTFK